MIRSRVVFLLPLVGVLALGCQKGDSSGASGRVYGTVTYKGKPVPAGTVSFQPKGQGPIATTNIAPDGSYEIMGVPPGDTIITVETDSVKTSNPENLPHYGPAGAKQFSPHPKDFQQSEASKGAYVQIPKKYSSKTSSPFHVTIHAGKQEQPLDLQ
jgi:hypothetical protein